MATHIIKGMRGPFAWLGFGDVETLCGTHVPAANGPDAPDTLDCPECRRLDQPKRFLGLF